MPTVTVTYDGGMRVDYDQALRKWADMIGGQSLGSGQMLMTPYTRDLSWKFATARKAQAFAKFVRETAKGLHMVVKAVVD